MHENRNDYQEGKIVFVFWKFSIMRSTDGAGTTWLVFRLLDGKEEKRKFFPATET